MTTQVLEQGQAPLASDADRGANLAPSNKSKRVVAEALSWLDTPYHHAADVKGVGVDCAMLLVRVFVDSGVLAPFDPRPYPHDWYLHHDRERFLGWIEQFATRLDWREPELPGDVRLYNFGRCVSHGAVVVSDGIMVHAWRPAGRVERCEVEWCIERYAATYRVRP